jgi:hypothetical protein
MEEEAVALLASDVHKIDRLPSKLQERRQNRIHDYPGLLRQGYGDSRNAVAANSEASMLGQPLNHF